MSSKGRHVVWRLRLSMVSFAASVVFFIFNAGRTPPPTACIDKLFPNLVGRAAIDYSWKNSWDFHAVTHVYKGAPTAERERAWDSVSPYGAIVTDQIPTSSRAGEDMSVNQEHELLVIPGVSLQMTCLKIIRRAFYEQPTPALYTPSSRKVVDQCIEKLRHDFLCAFEPTLFLEVNSNKSTSAHGVGAHVKSAHMCRDYDRIVNWARDNFARDSRGLKSFVELDL